VKMNAIFTRRSVRKYLKKAVEGEKIERLLKAAMQAPSAGNQQPWEFLVVCDEAMRYKLSEVSPYAGPVKEAPLAIVILGNEDGESVRFPEYLPQDLAAATENLLLEAVELGLGAVWLGVAPVEERMAAVRKLFVLPESVMPFAVVAVGYSEMENVYVDRYQKRKVHYEKYCSAEKNE
jgi:nitroreductase